MSAVLERPTFARAPMHSAPVRRSGIWSVDRVLALVIAAFGATIVGWGVNLYPAILGDEGIYSDQAHTVLGGRLTPYTYNYDHPFLGWLQLAPLQGLVRRIAGDGQLMVVSGRVVMVLYAFVSLVLVFHIARRLAMRRTFAVAAVLVLSLSPLFVTESRLVLLDNIAMPWVLGAFCLALNPRRRQWTYGMAGMAFGIGILTKETMLVALPPLVYLVWTRSYRPIRQMSLAAFATFGSLVVAIYPLFALLRGELFPGKGHVSLWTSGIEYQLSSRKGSGAIWQAGSSRRIILDSWLSYDAGLLYVGLGAGLCCLFVKRLRFLGIAMLLWLIPVIKPSGYLPQMYVVLMLPVCALAIVGILDAAASSLGHLTRPRVGFAVVAVVGTVLAGMAIGYYVPADRRVTTDGRNNQVRITAQAEAYLESHVSRADNLLLDPSYIGDLNAAGFPGPWHGTISYYKFDLDPLNQKRYLPHGWKDIDYVVETREMHDNFEYLGLTNLTEAIQRSTVVATFGSGTSAVLVRRVQPTAYNRTDGR